MVTQTRRPVGCCLHLPQQKLSSGNDYLNTQTNGLFGLLSDPITLTMANASVDTIEAALAGTYLSAQPSFFLGLPIELREEIYGHVISDDPASLRITFNAQPGATAPNQYHKLLDTCQQTRQEYTRVLLRHRGITATIHHFNFEPLLGFLSQLPDAYLDSLPKQLAPLDLAASDANHTTTEAGLHILLSIEGTHAAAVEGFRRWMLIQRGSEAVGQRLRVSYRLTDRPGLHYNLGTAFLALWSDFEAVGDDITRVESLGMIRCLLKDVRHRELSFEALTTPMVLQNAATEITRTFTAAGQNEHSGSSATLAS